MGLTGTTKTVQIEDANRKVRIGARSVEDDRQNSLESFPRPSRQGDVEHRILNLNRIKRQFTIDAKMSDEDASAINDGVNANISDKEDLKDEFDKVFEDQNLVTLTYGSDTFTGFLSKRNFKEEASEENMHYRIKFTFLKGVEMNS